ncbi:unnamed protein product, partial [Amoebophrya sp. A120]|eukprot:GSA120T00008836001.1
MVRMRILSPKKFSCGRRRKKILMSQKGSRVSSRSLMVFSKGSSSCAVPVPKYLFSRRSFFPTCSALSLRVGSCTNTK